MAVIFFGFFFRLGHLPLLSPDEGRNAEVGREMKESGAWLVPTYHGLDRLDKPAFFFKTVALSLSAFGDTETAARLPSALAGLSLVVLTAGFARRTSGGAAPPLAAIILATLPLYFANARTVILDMQLACFVAGAIFAGFLAEESEGKTRAKWYWGAAALGGCATLVKGPVGFLIPLLVLLVFNRVEGRKGVWRRLLAPLNWVVFFAITLPWFLGLCWRHPDFLRYGLIEESLHRFTSTRTFNRSEPFYFYLIIVALTFFPWSLLLPGAAWETWKRRFVTRSVDRLCIVWAIVTVTFFSVSASKLPGYILSVTVPTALLLARLFEAALARPAGRAALLARRSAGLLAITCALLGLTALVGHSQAPSLAKPLRIGAGEAEKLSEAALPIGFSLAVVAGLAGAAWVRRRPGLAFASLALLSPLTVTFGVRAFEVIFESKSSRAVAQYLHDLPPETELACIRCLPNGLAFYLHRVPVLISKDGHEFTSNYIAYFLQRNPWPAKQAVRLDEFDAWLQSRKTPVFLIAQKGERARLQALAQAHGATVENLPEFYFGLRIPAPETR